MYAKFVQVGVGAGAGWGTGRSPRKLMPAQCPLGCVSVLLERARIESALALSRVVL